MWSFEENPGRAPAESICERERELVRQTPQQLVSQLADVNMQFFEYAVEKMGHEPKAFIEAFMRSYTADRLDAPVSKYWWYDYDMVYDDFEYECEVKGIKLPRLGEISEEERRDLVEQAAWTGYIYRLWHYMTGDRSLEIIDKQPVDKMFLNYWGGHCEDPEGWIETELALEEERRAADGGAVL